MCLVCGAVQESSFTGFAVMTGNRLLRGGCSREIRVKWRVAAGNDCCCSIVVSSCVSVAR